ncbi:hypothetical protein PHMEG_00022298 [Phytophthora megakarya]|uniref:Uncharacterized protein n=1 Tax=Phytophthora megakarya TaxID=4795 RepID=A0A225VKQ9_9STRA|nr:hypothetical protein PHMEG_00022298 [Phytophthora megakarya]
MGTDFPPAPPERAPWGPGVYVGGTLFATFALGFTEGCLEIERRPIPLRFAFRFAAFNVLPSSVWSSVPARHVAAASGVPLSALISEAEVSGARSITVGKRLVLVKNNDKLENVKYGESVVRLAPINSPLSRTSKLKHGEHIVTVPMAKENWKMQGRNKALDAVDWEKVGVEVLAEEEVERIKVIEVEISDETATHAEKLKAKATTETDSVFSVAVLPMSGQPLPKSLITCFWWEMMNTLKLVKIQT